MDMITFEDAFMYEVGSSNLLPLLARGEFLTDMLTKYYVWKTKRKMKAYSRFVKFKDQLEKTLTEK